VRRVVNEAAQTRAGRLPRRGARSTRAAAVIGEDGLRRWPWHSGNPIE
jgi:hypothetical protein